MQSKISKIYLVGRRGPLQAAFTIKELREMLKLPDCRTIWQQEDFDGVPDMIEKLARPRKRITELMITSLNSPAKTCKNTFLPRFLRSPLEFVGEEEVSKVVLSVNELKNKNELITSAVPTDKTEQIDCSLAIRSIGYKSVQADSSLPFDSKNGVVTNTHGKVTDYLFAAGWVATGPTGVILTTMSNAFEIANAVAKGLKEVPVTPKPGYDELKNLLKKNNKLIVTWKGWEKIDLYEQEEGKKLGKPREKIVDIKKMLEIGGENVI